MIKDRYKFRVFEKTYIEYNKDLQRFIYSLTRNDYYAMEEIFQNTMVQATKGLNSLREPAKMKTWLYSIAKAEAKRYYARNQSIIEVKYYNDSEYDNISSIAIELNDFTKAVEDKELIISFINELTDEEQQIYILHYFYDISLKEISKVLNINYNTIRSLHSRGFKKIKKICRERPQHE